MKVLAAALISTTLFASVNASADTQFFAADNSPGTALCMAMTTNKPLKLHRELKETYLKKHSLADKLTCNDMSLAKFANTYGLNRTGKYLNLEVKTSTSIQDLAMAKKQIIYVSGSK